MVPDWFDPHAIFTLAPIPARTFAGVAGLVLLLAGSRAYRAAVVLPGLLLGAGLALAVGALLNLEAGPLSVAAVVAGIAGGLAAHFVEQFAVRVIGLVGAIGAVQVLGPIVLTGGTPWWAWPVAALLGGLLAPMLWKIALVPITAWIGAVVVVDAAGFPHHPLLVPGVAVAGVIVQLAAGRKSSSSDD